MTQSGATIRYTTDGSTPIASSATYSAETEITIPAGTPTMVKAIATKDGMNASEAATSIEFKLWTVTFDLDGGTGTVPDMQKVRDGEKVTTMPTGTFTKSGYEDFDASSGIWLNNTDTFDIATATVNGNITLKPQWVEKGKTAAPSIAWKDDTSNTLVIGANVTEGAAIVCNISGTPQAGNYTAPYEMDATSLNGQKITATAQEDGKLKSREAEFSVVIYDVTFSLNGGDGVAIEAEKIHSGGKVSEPTATPTWAEHTFNGWMQGDSSTVTDFTTAITADTTFKAKWIEWEQVTTPVITWSTDVDKVKIICDTVGTTIYYTTNGNVPTAESTAYSSEITIPAGTPTTVNAIAVKDGMKASEPGSNVFKLWTVTFDLDGGTGTVPDIQKVRDGGKASRPSGIFTKAMFKDFDANTGVWLNDTTEYDFDTATVTNNVTLKPEWVEWGIVVDLADNSTTSINSATLMAGHNYKITGKVVPADFTILMGKIPTTGDPITLDFGECDYIGELPEGEVYVDEDNPGHPVVPEDAQLSEIVLPRGITTIPNAFMSADWGSNIQDKLTDVSIPNTVTSIGEEAFNRCINLALIELPSGVTSIGANAFRSCTNLALTELPSGVTSIGANAFQSCTNLALTELPSGVTSIGGYAFYGCKGIESLTIPSTVTTLGENAFGNWKSTQTINVSWSDDTKTTGWNTDWHMAYGQSPGKIHNITTGHDL